ncbi:hypothetical protein EVAR_67682_1 [Eumeta japonica]|uniref:Uncharacterized protein n=1 Tax=Eumeta variegata TaxID=151549 RepID=A0A4C1ZHV6_EUMVA|nr:hypothetical protein EVAR_67682_1 [Eumeta japonica]
MVTVTLVAPFITKITFQSPLFSSPLSALPTPPALPSQRVNSGRVPHSSHPRVARYTRLPRADSWKARQICAGGAPRGDSMSFGATAGFRACALNYTLLDVEAEFELKANGIELFS